MFERLKVWLHPTAVPRAEAMLREAIALWTVHQDRPAAIEKLTACLKVYPELPEALYNRALIHAELGNDPQAMADFHHLTATGHAIGAQLRALFLLHSSATTSIGFARFESGQIQEAIQFFTRAAVYDPTNAAAFNNRGVALQAAGDEEGARSDFAKADTLGWSGPHVMFDTAEHAS